MTVRDDILAIPDVDLRKGNIAADYLVFMDFEDDPQRWWTGWGYIETGGHLWKGLGDFISISELSMSYAPSADQVTFTLSAATEKMLVLAREAALRATDRHVEVLQQFFSVPPQVAGGQPWQPLGPPFVVFTGTMDPMKFRVSRPSDDIQRTIELPAEGLFANRNAPANGRWTDADQKRRYPGDLGCDRMPIYTNYAPTWTV